MKNTSSQIYSIIGISLVLFLLGAIGWMAISGRSLSRMFKEKLEIDVILNDNTRDEKAAELEAILAKQPFVKSVDMITKEEAAKKYVNESGEDFVPFLGFNPLYISLRTTLYPEYVNPDSIAKITTFIQQSNIVREVYYPQGIVVKMDSLIKKVGIVLGIIALVLFIAVVMIIDNTVKLSMFSNRMLIKTMQMVGATRWFIVKPFAKSAIVSGLISGVLAVIGILTIRYMAVSLLPELQTLNNPVLFAILIIGLLLLGVLISLLSTYRSVIKYLKLKLDDLY